MSAMGLQHSESTGLEYLITRISEIFDLYNKIKCLK